MAFYVQDRPQGQLDGWSDDAKKAMTAGPEYFSWWEKYKTALLVAVTFAWLRQRAKNRARGIA